ncbi:transporter [Globodera pallida]|nr:transporter [Globodera pallida]
MEGGDELGVYIEYPFEETGGGGDENRIRGNWSSKLDYLLSAFGYTFALGNLWRFPYQCSVHGGFAFFIPYFVLFLVIALPICFIELSLGQFISLCPLSVWKLSPLFKGIGVSMVFISCIISVYYNIITSWAFYYMINSLKFPLPWATCGNSWNSENCSVWNKGAVETCRLLSGAILANGSCVNFGENLVEFGNKSNGTATAGPDPRSGVMPSVEYFHNQVLMISTGIVDFQTVNWQLAICLLISWLFVFLCSFKGIKTSGKVVYFVVVFPYVALVALFIRFITLPGSVDGLLHYMRPDWTALYDLTAWGDAAIQVFYSLSTCTGGFIMLSSYNRFHNNIFSDLWAIGIVDCVTSVLISSLVFSAIGFVVFVFFVEALSKLPVAQIYSLLFFTMVAFVVFNSELFIVETIVSSICDQFPERLRRNHRHVLTFTLFTFFLLGLPLCTAAGIYWIILFEHFSATWPLIIIGFFEVMTVCWIYGVDNFLDNIKWMIGFYPPVYLLWKIFWKFFCPIILLALLSLVWLQHVPLQYNSFLYPRWSVVFGWTISLSPVIIILFMFFYQFSTVSGSFSKRLRELLCPTDDWGPALAVHRAELYPMQIPEAQKLMTPPTNRVYRNTTNGNSVEQFMDRYSRPIGKGVYPQQEFDQIISRKPLPEKETII